MKPPRDDGKYFVRAIALGDPASQPDGKSEPKRDPREYKATSELVEIKVKSR